MWYNSMVEATHKDGTCGPVAQLGRVLPPCNVTRRRTPRKSVWLLTRGSGVRVPTGPLYFKISFPGVEGGASPL